MDGVCVYYLVCLYICACAFTVCVKECLKCGCEYSICLKVIPRRRWASSGWTSMLTQLNAVAVLAVRRFRLLGYHHLTQVYYYVHFAVRVFVNFCVLDVLQTLNIQLQRIYIINSNNAYEPNADYDLCVHRYIVGPPVLKDIILCVAYKEGGRCSTIDDNSICLSIGKVKFM